MRKSRILEAIDKHRYLRRWMVEDMFFKIPSGKRRSQALLKKMTDERLLKRFRLGPREDYIYYQGKRSEKWRHWLMLNEFHFSLLRSLHSWQVVLFWEYEHKYPYGVADAIYVVKRTLESGIKFFLEMDDGANSFDKVGRYEAYYTSRKWEKESWADPLGKGKTFPLVVVMTPRVAVINEKVKEAGSVKFIVLERSNNKDLLRRISDVQPVRGNEFTPTR